MAEFVIIEGNLIDFVKGASSQMKLLEERIMEQGQVRPGNVLKVDCFLNHQLDVDLLDKIGEEFYRIFKDDGINKILTIEASGIAIACMTARHFNVPVVFAKKAKSKNSTATFTLPPYILIPTAVITISPSPRSSSPPLTRC